MTATTESPDVTALRETIATIEASIEAAGGDADGSQTVLDAQMRLLEARTVLARLTGTPQTSDTTTRLPDEPRALMFLLADYLSQPRQGFTRVSPDVTGAVEGLTLREAINQELDNGELERAVDPNLDRLLSDRWRHSSTPERTA